MLLAQADVSRALFYDFFLSSSADRVCGVLRIAFLASTMS